ncbi:hypothetical protein CAL21_21590 [Bordetella genomosp. 4]|nr:hypothetical protein CAL21_21590 [Bordetella genomosp. 4]
MSGGLVPVIERKMGQCKLAHFLPPDRPKAKKPPLGMSPDTGQSPADCPVPGESERRASREVDKRAEGAAWGFFLSL